jgi:hypothetical protein
VPEFVGLNTIIGALSLTACSMFAADGSSGGSSSTGSGGGVGTSVDNRPMLLLLADVFRMLIA